MAEPEAEIVALIAKKMGLEASAIRPDSRLAQDLGMDGDDAAEFFEVWAGMLASLAVSGWFTTGSSQNRILQSWRLRFGIL